MTLSVFRTAASASCLFVPIGVECAAAPTLEPVGPETSGAYTPAGMNERGDVTFRVWASLLPGWDHATPGLQAEVRYADGTALRLSDPGFLSIEPGPLLENGAFVGLYETPGDPLPDGGTLANQDWRLVNPDGGWQTVTGTRPKAWLADATSAGALIGSTAASYAWNDEGDVDEIVPLVWDAATGPVELPLPGELTHGYTRWANPAGGYVGGASDGLRHGQSAYVWWDASGEVAAAVDASVLAPATSEWSGIAGVRADGALIGALDGRVVELHADGVLRPVTGEMTGLRVYAVNASGVVLGGYLGAAWKYVAWMPDGTEIDLGAAFAGTGWEIGQLVDITDRGDVLVDAFRPNAPETQAFVIHHVPGPGSAALALMAGVMAITRRRR